MLAIFFYVPTYFMLFSFNNHARGKPNLEGEELLKRVPLHYHVLRVVFIAILFVFGFKYWDRYFKIPFDRVLYYVGVGLFCLFFVGHFLIAKVKEKLNERSKSLSKGKNVTTEKMLGNDEG